MIPLNRWARFLAASFGILTASAVMAGKPTPPPPPPLVENVEIDHGASLLIIHGANFGQTQGTSTVTIGGTPVAVALSDWSASDIVGALPVGLRAASYLLVVQTTAGESRFEVAVVPPVTEGPMKVLSANGVVVGYLVAATDWAGEIHVLREGVRWKVDQLSGAFFAGQVPFHYENLTCTGQAYTTTLFSRQVPLVAHGGQVVPLEPIFHVGGPIRSVALGSYFLDGICHVAPWTGDVYPLVLGTVTPGPYAGPLEFAPRAL